MSVGQLLPLCSSDPMKYGEFGFGSKSGVKEPDCGLVRDMNLVGDSMVFGEYRVFGEYGVFGESMIFGNYMVFGESISKSSNLYKTQISEKYGLKTFLIFFEPGTMFDTNVQKSFD